MKTMFTSLLLALLMLFVTPALNTTAYAAVAPADSLECDDFPIDITTPGTVIVERRGWGDYIHLFLEDGMIATMSEDFILNYVADEMMTSWSASTDGGYLPLAQQIIQRFIDGGQLVLEPEPWFGNVDCTIVFDPTAEFVDNDTDGSDLGEVLAHYNVDAMVSVMGDVTLDVFRKDGTETVVTMFVQQLYDSSWNEEEDDFWYWYEDEYQDDDGIDISSISYDILAVRNLNEDTVEVFLRDGIVATLEKDMIVKWLTDDDFIVGCGPNTPKVCKYGHCFIVNLLNELSEQGWVAVEATDIAAWDHPFDEVLVPSVLEEEPIVSATRCGYMSIEAWEPLEEVAISDRSVSWKGLTYNPILIDSIESMRSKDTTVNVEFYFEHFKDGTYDHTDQFEADFTFLQRADDGEIKLYQLIEPDDFAYRLADTIWLTDEELGVIMR